MSKSHRNNTKSPWRGMSKMVKVSSEVRLSEFKRLKSDRKAHPDAVQASWEAFIEAVEGEVAQQNEGGT